MEVPYDERKLENILRTPWASDGKNFSQRIWKDRTQLVNNLQKNYVMKTLKNLKTLGKLLI